jgi:hypothetical protein
VFLLILLLERLFLHPVLFLSPKASIVVWNHLFPNFFFFFFFVRFFAVLRDVVGVRKMDMKV